MLNVHCGVDGLEGSRSATSPRTIEAAMPSEMKDEALQHIHVAIYTGNSQQLQYRTTWVVPVQPGSLHIDDYLGIHNTANLIGLRAQPLIIHVHHYKSVEEIYKNVEEICIETA